MAPDLLRRSTAAALVASEIPATPADIGVFLDTNDESQAGVAARGYADVIRLVMDHGSELPFAESQIKYFHSLLLRYDTINASSRRQCRAPGVEPSGGGIWGLRRPPATAALPSELSQLIAESREAIDRTSSHPLTLAGAFVGRFLTLRPFAVGNTRLGFALTVYLLDRFGYSHVRFSPLEEVLCARGLEGAAASRCPRKTGISTPGSSTSSTPSASPRLAFSIPWPEVGIGVPRIRAARVRAPPTGSSGATTPPPASHANPRADARAPSREDRRSSPRARNPASHAQEGPSRPGGWRPSRR